MSLRFKLTALGLFGAACVGLYLAWHHHVEQLGAAKVEARDARLALEAKQRVLEQIQRDAKTNEDAVNALHAENDRLAAALAAAPAPVIRVCEPARGSGLPAAPGPAGGAREAAAGGGGVPGVPRGDQPSVDIGPGVQLLAELGERLSAQLRAIQERERSLGARDQ